MTIKAHELRFMLMSCNLMARFFGKQLLASWVLGFKVSCFQSLLASWFQSFLESKLQSFNDPILPKFHFMFSGRYRSHIQDFKTLLDRSSGISDACFPKLLNVSNLKIRYLCKQYFPKMIWGFHGLFEVSWSLHWFWGSGTRPKIPKS